MCTRYLLTSPSDAVRAVFRYRNVEHFPPRYNIAPTQPVLIVRNGRDGEREAQLVRWALLPPWVKEPSTFSVIVNARAETIAEKPSFRGAIRHRRCLVPADGFYEWTGGRGAKQPHLIRLTSRAMLAFAGIWEHWLGADGSELETMAIVTTSGNDDMSVIHDRMPVILDPSNWDAWLDCSSGTATGVLDLLRPLAPNLIDIVAVDPRINNSKFDGQGVLQPVDAGRLL